MQSKVKRSPPTFPEAHNTHFLALDRDGKICRSSNPMWWSAHRSMDIFLSPMWQHWTNLKAPVPTHGRVGVCPMLTHTWHFPLLPAVKLRGEFDELFTLPCVATGKGLKSTGVYPYSTGVLFSSSSQGTIRIVCAWVGFLWVGPFSLALKIHAKIGSYAKLTLVGFSTDMPKAEELLISTLVGPLRTTSLSAIWDL